MSTLQDHYQLLIFDWDGTLQDSSARIVHCMHNAARHLDLPLADGASIRTMIGLSLEVVIAHLYPTINKRQLQLFAAEFRRHSLGNELKASQLFDGVLSTLEHLSAQGYHLAVATGKSRAGLDNDLIKLGVGHLFPITRTADETFSKPNPQMLEEIMTDYDLTAKSALMVGDTEYDLQMAHNIGMDSLAVSYGVHDQERLLQQRPAGLIGDFAELPAWLESKNE